jgi:hypothetical protein
MVAQPARPDPQITLPELERELRRLGAVYGRAITADTAVAWYGAIAFMPPAVLRLAIDRCIFERDRFPAPGNIIDYADGIVTAAGLLPPAPDEAWNIASQNAIALARMPGVGLADLGIDPDIIDSVQDIGGALRIREATNYDAGNLRRDFTRVYARRRAARVIPTIAAALPEQLPAPIRYDLPADVAPAALQAPATARGARTRG